MGNIKAQLKMPITFDLQLFMAKKLKGDKVNKEDAIEIGAHVAANFMRTIFKEKQAVSSEEISAILGNIIDFYNNTFSGQFTEDDRNSLTKSAMQILQTPNSEQVTSSFFNKIMSL